MNRHDDDECVCGHLRREHYKGKGFCDAMLDFKHNCLCEEFENVR